MMSNFNNSTLYTGVTNNLKRRIAEHKEGKSVFTKRYNLTKLVYYEASTSPGAAIFREKQIKAGSRKKKNELVNELNPDWKDLFDGLFD